MLYGPKCCEKTVGIPKVYYTVLRKAFRSVGALTLGGRGRWRGVAKAGPTAGVGAMGGALEMHELEKWPVASVLEDRLTMSQAVVGGDDRNRKEMEALTSRSSIED